MINNRILTIVLLVVGMILLYLAYRSSQSLLDQVTEVVTGRFTDSTTWLLILGAVPAVAGVGKLLMDKFPGN